MSIKNIYTDPVCLIETKEILGWTAYYSPAYERMSGDRYGIFNDPEVMDVAEEGLEFLQFRRAERKIK